MAMGSSRDQWSFGASSGRALIDEKELLRDGSKQGVKEVIRSIVYIVQHMQ